MVDETSNEIYNVVAIRTTGVHPEAVAEMLEAELSSRGNGGSSRVEPIVYNSSTTGYLLLVFVAESAEHA